MNLKCKIGLVLAALVGSQVQAMELYVDQRSGQVFTSPGKHRTKLGNFEQAGVAKNPTTKIATTEDVKKIESKLNTRIDGVVNKPKRQSETFGTMDDKGIRFETNDGQFKFAMNGRLETDADGYSGGDFFTYADTNNNSKADKNEHVTNNRLTDGTEIRRMRMEFSGQFYNDWKFKLQPELANGGGDLTVGIRDAYIQYTGLNDWGSFYVGQSKQPYSYQQMMSDTNLAFMERSTEYEFTNRSVNRAIGLRYDLGGQQWGFSTGVFGDTATRQTSGTTTQGDEGWGGAVRLTGAPWMKSDELFHVGGSAAFRAPATQNRTVQYKIAPTAISQVTYLNTGAMPDVENSQFINGELLGIYGPLSLEAEYNATWIHSNDSLTSGKGEGQDILEGSGFFQGAHVDAIYSLTGETRAAGYDALSGVTKRIKPNKNFTLSGDGYGAFETKARFMWVDMNQIGNSLYAGGNQVASTFGVNWYPNNWARVMLDWTHVYSLDIGKAGINRTAVAGQNTGDWDYVQARVQLVY